MVQVGCHIPDLSVRSLVLHCQSCLSSSQHLRWSRLDGFESRTRERGLAPWTIGPPNQENSLQGWLLAAEDDENGQLAWDAPKDSRCGQSRWQSKPARTRGRRSRTGGAAGKPCFAAWHTHQETAHWANRHVHSVKSFLRTFSL